MKNFTIYTKGNLKKPLKLSEIIDIRYLKEGIRLAYIFDITGIIYAISRKLYKLTFALILLMIAFEFLFNNFPEYGNFIFIFKTIINITIALFANDIEEFFLKLKGYKTEGIVFAKNAKMAQFLLEEEVKMTLKK